MTSAAGVLREGWRRMHSSGVSRTSGTPPQPPDACGMSVPLTRACDGRSDRRSRHDENLACVLILPRDPRIRPRPLPPYRVTHRSSAMLRLGVNGGGDHHGPNMSGCRAPFAAPAVLCWIGHHGPFIAAAPSLPPPPHLTHAIWPRSRLSPSGARSHTRASPLRDDRYAPLPAPSFPASFPARNRVTTSL